VWLRFPLLAEDDEDWRDVLSICAALFWLLVVLWAQVVCQLGRGADSTSRSSQFTDSCRFVWCGGQASSGHSSRLVLYLHRALLYAPVALVVVGAVVPAAIPKPAFWMGVVGCAWLPIVVACMACYHFVFDASSLIPRFQKYADVRSTEAVAQLCVLFVLPAYLMSSSMAIQALLDSPSSSSDPMLAVIMLVLGLAFPALYLCAAVVLARSESCNSNAQEEDARRRPTKRQNESVAVPWNPNSSREPVETGFVSFMKLVGRGILANYKEATSLYAFVTIVERPLIALLVYLSAEK
jgi:hypothetical protein